MWRAREYGPKAIDRLCSVFGFEERIVVPNDDGTIAHAQLGFGNGMSMLGSILSIDNRWCHDDAWGFLIPSHAGW